MILPSWHGIGIMGLKLLHDDEKCCALRKKFVCKKKQSKWLFLEILKQAN